MKGTWEKIGESTMSLDLWFECSSWGTVYPSCRASDHWHILFESVFCITASFHIQTALQSRSRTQGSPSQKLWLGLGGCSSPGSEQGHPWGWCFRLLQHKVKCSVALQRPGVPVQPLNEAGHKRPAKIRCSAWTWRSLSGAFRVGRQAGPEPECFTLQLQLKSPYLALNECWKAV